jgi:O-antigen ligase
MRSNRRILAVLIVVPALAIAYFWQAGEVMKSRAATISDYKVERSAATRLEAWEAAIAMARNYPIFGVGLASFGPAFPDHSVYEPRVAHNTFFQITAESGIPAGLVYILLNLAIMSALWRNGQRLRAHAEAVKLRFLRSVNEATFVGFVGILVCGLFLSLQVYEVFWFLCLMANSSLFLARKAMSEEV